MLDGGEDSPGTAQQSSPPEEPPLGEECCRRVRGIAVFDSYPVIYEVPSLLSIRYAPHVRDDHFLFPPKKLKRILAHNQLTDVSEGQKVHVTPSVLMGKVPDAVERLCCHSRPPSLKSNVSWRLAINLLAVAEGSKQTQCGG